MIIDERWVEKGAVGANAAVPQLRVAEMIPPPVQPRAPSAEQASPFPFRLTASDILFLPRT